MQASGRQPQQALDGAPVHYERHRPEQTTLYHLVQQHAATSSRKLRPGPAPCDASRACTYLAISPDLADAEEPVNMRHLLVVEATEWEKPSRCSALLRLAYRL